MLDEEVEDADFVLLDLREFFEDVVGDQVAAARAGREREGFLEPRHDFVNKMVGWNRLFWARPKVWDA